MDGFFMDVRMQFRFQGLFSFVPLLFFMRLRVSPRQCLNLARIDLVVCSHEAIMVFSK
jgi:hypothetical protein